MAYVVRFSFDVEHADSFEDAVTSTAPQMLGGHRAG